MTDYVLEDLDSSDSLLRRVPLATATSLDEAIARAKQRMNSYWSRKGPPGSEWVVRVLDDTGVEHFRWSWAKEQNDYSERQNRPYYIIKRHPGQPEVELETRTPTDFRFFRTQLDEAKAKAREIMAEAAKKEGRKTDLLAVEVCDERGSEYDPVFRYTKEDHFGTK